MHVCFAIFQAANFKLQNGSAIIPADTSGPLCSECPGKYIAGLKEIHSLNFAALKQNVSEETVPIYTLLQVSFKLNCRFLLSVAPQSVLSQAAWESHTEDPLLTHFPNKAGSCEGRAHATAALLASLPVAVFGIRGCGTVVITPVWQSSARDGQRRGRGQTPRFPLWIFKSRLNRFLFIPSSYWWQQWNHLSHFQIKAS